MFLQCAGGDATVAVLVGLDLDAISRSNQKQPKRSQRFAKYAVAKKLTEGTASSSMLEKHMSDTLCQTLLDVLVFAA